MHFKILFSNLLPYEMFVAWSVINPKNMEKHANTITSEH